eukprot:TRINITY_DN24368_c0_g1_i1.p1 TRINITY_DN24368_c0_g1~~TRINITY_DN24368_c0_g1_i1.p1  ORF type:complete len:433 (+),score=88.69 TRINITY_DN24368_c0_g1_i1:66-1364(+)
MAEGALEDRRPLETLWQELREAQSQSCAGSCGEPAKTAALPEFADLPVPEAIKAIGITEGWTLAHQAAFEGSVERLQLLDRLSQSFEGEHLFCRIAGQGGQDLRAPLQRGVGRALRSNFPTYTPARVAAFAGHLDVLHYLAEHDENRIRNTVRDTRHFRRLAFSAATTGRVAVLQFLFDLAGQIGRRPFWAAGYGPHGESLALVAALRGELDVLKYLLGLGTSEQHAALIKNIFLLNTEADRTAFYGAICSNVELLRTVMELINGVSTALGFIGNPEDTWDFRGTADWVIVRAVREKVLAVPEALLTLQGPLARRVFESKLKDAELGVEGNLLHLAAAHGWRELLHIVAAHPELGASASLFGLPSVQGETPAAIARRHGHEQLARFLDMAADESLGAGPRSALDLYERAWQQRIVGFVEAYARSGRCPVACS